MNTNHWMPVIGMAAGIVLGLAAAFGGLGAFLLVLVLGAVGFLVGLFAAHGEVRLPNAPGKRR
ncbi:DUF2273 domain-containing protein [Nonomuraea jiangxiensis]|uniref:Small integral membrane protein n=1 Tax=Nonomuraea jiangxiensis TaxID=633440 RepID=A0A1G8ZIE9_9ACTN|nr:DUF2273 domain-containing protein [Nonomuraea jiangxiensis]SDK14364.1 Small integral membrane protein [Nonomuraea jiangxiensis]